MNIIVAVDKNWAIGKNNKMMWSIPACSRDGKENIRKLSQWVTLEKPDKYRIDWKFRVSCGRYSHRAYYR